MHNVTTKELIKAGICITNLYIESISISDLNSNQFRLKSSVGNKIRSHRFHKGYL